MTSWSIKVLLDINDFLNRDNDFCNTFIDNYYYNQLRTNTATILVIISMFKYLIWLYLTILHTSKSQVRTT